MVSKPDAEDFIIKEQIVRDPVSGLTFQFECKPGSDAPFRMKVFGDIPHGNREILFDCEGNEAGAGVALVNACTPNWIKVVT